MVYSTLWRVNIANLKISFIQPAVLILDWEWLGTRGICNSLRILGQVQWGWWQTMVSRDPRFRGWQTKGPRPQIGIGIGIGAGVSGLGWAVARFVDTMSPQSFQCPQPLESLPQGGGETCGWLLMVDSAGRGQCSSQVSGEPIVTQMASQPL